ncbi:MAG: hypothetical protein RLZZ444_557 [Pseudomonadota bacterium]|jgi:glyoxylase-like metal-dependent hydrolase (beta-lactamase superfamily II)
MSQGQVADAGRGLVFPHAVMPEFGHVVEIADGILWTRLPLPFQLDHVNIYLLRDGDGWAVIDTGIKTEAAMAAWERIFEGPLKGNRISRVIVTHYHPDHIGLAGWLCERFDCPLLTSYSSYAASLLISFPRDEAFLRQHFDFYTSHGMSQEGAGIVAIQGNDYLKMVDALPGSFLRLLMADVIDIGGRSFRILSGDGHAPEQIMLYCEDEKLLFAADQVIEKISPNISVYASDPNGDPLGHFLRSLRFLRANLPEDVLVLSGHRRPFIGLQQRCEELERHHEERCDAIRAACAKAPHTVAELVPFLFHRSLNPHEMSFAFTEAIAHVNRLIRRGEIRSERNGARIVNLSA